MVYIDILRCLSLSGNTEYCWRLCSIANTDSVPNKDIDKDVDININKDVNEDVDDKGVPNKEGINKDVPDEEGIDKDIPNKEGTSDDANANDRRESDTVLVKKLGIRATCFSIIVLFYPCGVESEMLTSPHASTWTG